MCHRDTRELRPCEERKKEEGHSRKRKDATDDRRERERKRENGGCYAPSCTKVASVGPVGYAHINP
ncbi:hypothetical protein X777_08580 [Ooceraea biroi]|uniref:Uncharacterized protein n=1 Tax=Ooceraea biroi TaxID=2015173 RepID=A0A026W8L0_OOCBI|nr:hypothetical protein X777_08580 [Ooceraea biroi]